MWNFYWNSIHFYFIIIIPRRPLKYEFLFNSILCCFLVRKSNKFIKLIYLCLIQFKTTESSCLISVNKWIERNNEYDICICEMALSRLEKSIKKQKFIQFLIVLSFVLFAFNHFQRFRWVNGKNSDKEQVLQFESHRAACLDKSSS